MTSKVKICDGQPTRRTYQENEWPKDSYSVLEADNSFTRLHNGKIDEIVSQNAG